MKMNIKDLKVGDAVYIREDLEDDKLYGNNVYIDDMCKGIQEIGLVSRENGIIRTVETPDYSYTPEMIDWEKTIKLRGEKMNINDLKVGDIVFIREDLEPGTIYCGQMYVYDMGNGVKQVKNIYSDKSFTVIGGNCYLYAPEMIDWNKTKDLQNDNCHNFEKITQFVENGREKTIALTNNGKEFTVTNNDKENDIEKSVMMLMLKSMGVTYGDVKKEVEKVKVKWIPKDGEKYYYIKTTGDVDFLYWAGSSYDNGRLTFNNCFKTREEAEEKLEKIKEVLRGE